MNDKKINSKENDYLLRISTRNVCAVVVDSFPAVT